VREAGARRRYGSRVAEAPLGAEAIASMLDALE